MKNTSATPKPVPSTPPKMKIAMPRQKLFIDHSPISAVSGGDSFSGKKRELLPRRATAQFHRRRPASRSGRRSDRGSRCRPDRQRSSKRDRCRWRSEEHTSELQSQFHLVCRLLLEKKNQK